MWRHVEDGNVDNSNSSTDDNGDSSNNDNNSTRVLHGDFLLYGNVILARLVRVSRVSATVVHEPVGRNRLITTVVTNWSRATRHMIN